MSQKKIGATFLSSFLLLFFFWVLITWRLHWQHIVVGIACSAAVAYFNQELTLRKTERPLILTVTASKWLKYFLSLVIDIVKSNWEVAKIVLTPKMNISPCFVKFRTKIKKPLNRVILGNSITLTPGTLTVEVEDDYYLVHALTVEYANSVAAWEMADKLAAIEEVEENA